MNILERIEYHKNEYEKLKMLPDMIELYFDSYDTENMSVDDMMKEFFHVYGTYDITNKDFVYIAKSLGYVYKQVSIDGERFYTLTKE